MESYENRHARFEETRLRNAIETGTRQPSARAPAALATRTSSSRSNEMEKKFHFLRDRVRLFDIVSLARARTHPHRLTWDFHLRR